MPESASTAGRFIAARTLAAWLIGTALLAGGASPAQADQAASGKDLGSIYEYEQSAERPADYANPLLGIEVKNRREWLGGNRWLEHGRWVDGVEILSVVPGSPGGAAGLEGSRPGPLQTTVLMTGIVAAAFFPPAIMAVMALNKAAEQHSLIIAVDARRVADVIDFEHAIENIEPGEVVYLTVVRHGERQQVPLALPVQ